MLVTARPPKCSHGRPLRIWRALTTRYLGLRVVIAKSFTRIHWQNLVSFGVLPLRFADPGDYERIGGGDTIRLESLHTALLAGTELTAENATKNERYRLWHDLSPRQIEILLAGGLIPTLRNTRPHKTRTRPRAPADYTNSDNNSGWTRSAPPTRPPQ